MTSALALRPIPSPAPANVRTLALARDAHALDLELDATELATEMAPDLLRDVILPSAVLSSSDCLDVYRRMYADRVELLLGREHPATRAALGDELFQALVRDYIDSSPANAHVLTKAGERLPDYLAETRLLPREKAAWIAELAAFERSLARAATADSGETLTAEALGELPLDRWDSARLEAAPSLELHAFEHRIDELYEAWQRSGEVEAPLRRGQWLAIFRQGSQVQRVAMTRRAWLVLAGLCAGRPLASAFHDPFGATSRAATQRRVRAWLRAWIANGLFRTVHAS